LKDRDIFGGSDINKRMELFRERESSKQLKKLEAQEKLIEEYRRKEEERMAPFKALVSFALL
jgi:hypothetical protein